MHVLVPPAPHAPLLPHAAEVVHAGKPGVPSNCQKNLSAHAFPLFCLVSRFPIFLSHAACRSCKPGEPVDLLQLPFANDNLHFVLVNPKFEAPTAQMRAVLPKEVPMKSMINNCCQGGALVGAALPSYSCVCA